MVLLANYSQKLIAPIGQAVVAIVRVLSIGGCSFLKPGDKEIPVFFEQQELPQNDIGLVEPFFDEASANRWSDACQIGDGLIAHRFGNEAAMLLGCSLRDRSSPPLTTGETHHLKISANE